MRWGLRLAMLSSGVALSAVAACAAPTSQEDVVPTSFIEAPVISSKATDRYGPGAADAYQEVAQFAMREWVLTPLVDPARRSKAVAQELTDGVTSHLAPDAAAEWKRLTAKAVSGDTASIEAVRLLRLFDMPAADLSLPADRPAVTAQAITAASVDVARALSNADVPLKISFHHEARVGYVSGRVDTPVSYERDVSFTVLPATAFAARAASPTTPPRPVGPAPSAEGAPRTPTAAPPSAGRPSPRWLIVDFEGDLN